MPRDDDPRDDDRRLVALYEAHGPSVWRYVVHLTGDAAGADDIVQETLLRAWRTPRILAQEPASTRSWMITVARNLVIDEARSARRRHEVDVAEAPEPPAPAMRDATDALFESLLIEEALVSLTIEHRAVIVHAYYGGCSVAEVARRLGIPEGTVKSRLHYGLRALRLALQEKGVTR
ncbi:sigma-70 family RNA polymerase sigma factor [Agromyces endophyticus]|uniref:sigma-70 family RNA polymerase sigma factor n=1 Tax=Agromyces sp. H17E-10 TaxID=2932244 RepID=UPI001FD4547A|nr:sigma-70 family RNA polymerase sigma factor [Agromyces sp. H17E-10]UOQ88623.1 sigma-70 family RNA polymerase sigma factor [Agromyces sp. H17E-10]